MSRQALKDLDGDGHFSPEEHHAWALSLWNRMDRDHSGTITKEELDCDEFQNVVRGIIAPDSNSGGSGGVTYSRASMNIRQAMDFCIRKADQNFDGRLTFEEFKAFLKVLNNSTDAKQSANLIFALFDLNGDQTIEKDEFREIYRYFLGHNPTAAELEDEWSRLDYLGKQVVTRADYTRWLQTSTNPIFKQHAPPIEDAQGYSSAESSLQRSHSQRPFRMKPFGHDDRPKWNQAWNQQLNPNEHVSAGMRTYFSRPQSLPELKRWSGTKQRYKAIKNRLHDPAFEPPKKPIWYAVFSGNRHTTKQGSMTSHRSREDVVFWEDFWQTPAAQKVKRVSPGALSLQTPCKPPSHLLAMKPEDY
eukprot:gnl/TRDRNA2_/TRDRNA2_187528_c0_seq1.p1 gnl/TRDRNA2_/TRDRNA2_187528_c0~~gnl/TRDRNA2_/TRDRNA2_187528_c0_seq1.p1  ORF type:complete len:360 (+),score=40.02 gnl/TRDRNA2_/TRDRNA2_187528_c0_seq1:46-1125(+)